MDDDWILVDRTKKVCIKTAASNVEFIGYDIDNLEECWFVAVNRFFAPGGGAEQV